MVTVNRGISLDGDIKYRVRFALHRGARIWGAPGIVTVLLACCLTAFAIFWIAPSVRRLAILEARSTERSSLPSLPTVTGQDTETNDLSGFYKSFPPQSLVLDITGQINQVAEQSGMRITQAEYRPNQDLSGLVRYEVSLSARGTYSQLRSFTAACLTRFPTLSLDALTLSRSTATEVAIDAQFRFSIYLAVN
jgi:Tfp pilus assembly protein PilO